MRKPPPYLHRLLAWVVVVEITIGGQLLLGQAAIVASTPTPVATIGSGVVPPRDRDGWLHSARQECDALFTDRRQTLWRGDCLVPHPIPRPATDAKSNPAQLTEFDVGIASGLSNMVIRTLRLRL